MYINLAHRYFVAFAKKDASALRTMMAPDVYLRDWDLEAVGIDAVIAASQSIFDAVKTIEVCPVNVFQDGTTVIAELLIKINSEEFLKVVDLLTFDIDGKIVSIRAYKG